MKICVNIWRRLWEPFKGIAHHPFALGGPGGQLPLGNNIPQGLHPASVAQWATTEAYKCGGAPGHPRAVVENLLAIQGQ